jgi:hypothetical protein
VILDLYYNWNRIGVRPECPKPKPKPILEGAEIYKHPYLVELGIKDFADDYEVMKEEEVPLLSTKVEYYNDSRGERKYRTIHI